MLINEQDYIDHFMINQGGPVEKIKSWSIKSRDQRLLFGSRSCNRLNAPLLLCYQRYLILQSVDLKQEIVTNVNILKYSELKASS